MKAPTKAADPKMYVVLVNDEAQYSIWPTTMPLPNGWRDAGRTGTKPECLAYVDEVSADEPAGAAEAAEAIEFVEPVTAAERQACSGVAEVLGIDRVGVNDNFFVRGGTSLLAIRLLEKLRAVGLEASLKDVFEAGDVGELARRLRPLRKLHEAPPNKIPPDAQRITREMLTLVDLPQDQIDEIVALVPGGASNVQDIYPLTPLQEGFVFQHLASEVDPYLTSLILHFDAEQDLARFTRGLDEIVTRHDIFRTAVVWHIRPRPVQVVWRHAAISIERRDSVTTEDELLAIGAAQSSGFDLQRAPLVRATAAPNPQGGWSLLLVLHHVIDDDMLLRNLASELNALAEGRSLPAPAPFRNFVSYLSSRDPKASESFWRGQLDGLREPTNPIRERRARPAAYECVLGRDLTERVRATSRACAVVPAALMHLAYAIVLARRSGTDDVVFGTVLNGRSAPVVGLEATAGMFLSTLPVRVRLDTGSVRSALSRMHALLAELPAHDHVSLPLIQSWSSIRPPAPLFAALLNVRHATDDGTDRLFHGDLGVRDGRASEATHYPFALGINDVASGYQLGLETVADDGEDVLTRFEQVLACIVADVEQPVTAVLPRTAVEESARRSLAFWRAKLAGAPQAIYLPTDGARDGSGNHERGLVSFQVAPFLEKKLAEFNVDHDVTRYVTLLSAFVALLYRYTRQEDMVIGSPVATGHSSDALPLRVSARGEESFRELVHRVRETALEALDHQAVSLEDIARAIGTGPLFRVMFALQPIPIEHTSAMFDLILTLGDEGNGLKGSVNYASDLFDAGTAARLVRHYLALLGALLADPERPIGEQPLISEDERRQVLEAGRGAVTELPDGGLAQIFESVVARQPEALAVVCANVAGRPSLTYGELNRRANQLARYLLAASPTRLARVGIVMERSLASLVSTLAVLKAGSAYVPLDPHSPADRLRFVIDDTDLDLVLTDGAAALDVGGRPTLDLRERGAAISALPDGNLAHHAGADELAYIMYTSGSTGRPKGVCVLQRGVVRLVCNTNYFTASRDDRFTHLSPTTFDAATFEIWGCLLNGAAMVLIEGRQPSLDTLAEAIEHERASVMLLTTGLFKLMVDHRLDALKHVRYLATGGDVAPLAQVKKVLAELPGCTLVNGYGPTENTTISATFQVPAGHPCARALPIGKPIANSSAFVMDARGELVPCGVIGELYVGGAGVAQGYWKQPELTAERFVTLPTLGDGRLYRTGDLARWRADGNLDFLGRADQQVKIRGFRIELGEVESVLRQHALVTDAVVCVWQPSEADPKRLVAYVVVGDHADVGVTELCSYLERRLPEYMVPANYVFLEALPLNAHQKVDRRALPPPDDTQVAFAAPATEEETLLCRIWAELLGLERLGTRDDLFERGGDSLLALQAAMRARKQGFEVDPEVFLQHRTVQASAPRMTRCDRPLRASSPADADDRSLPLSASQQAMLVHSLVSGAPDLYIQHIELPLSGSVDAQIMRDALAALVARHPALRVSFAIDDDGIGRQRIHDDVEVAFSYADLSGLDPAAQRQHHEALRKQDRRRGSHLSSPALVWFRLFKEAEDAYRLAIVHHHIVLDGWSLSILIEELHGLYHDRLFGRQTPRLAEPPPSIQSYAKWCAERATGALEAFWRAELAGFEEVTTFDSVTRTPAPGAAFDHRECHARLNSAEVRPLSMFAANHGLTLSTLFQGALAYVLSRLCGCDDVMFGMIVSGRHASCPQADERVGLLINTLPLRTKLSPEAPVLAWLREQQQRLGAMREHGTVTQEQLRACSDLRPGAGPFRLFDCVLIFENFPAPAARGGDSRFEFGEMNFSVPLHLPVVISVIPTGNTIRLQCGYDGRLFDEASAQQLLQSLRHVVSELVRCGGQGRLQDLSLPTVAEAALLARWNDTTTAGPRGDIYGLFAQRAGAQPDAVAIQAGSRRVTYADLHRDAEALARRLRRSGVQAGERVALYFERSPELVTAMLAVLRARACFVPLSTTEPKKRVDLKLADAAPALVLTVQALQGRLEGVECLCVDVAAPEARAALVAEPEPVGEEAPAYVIYTSGSTGAPKGVVVSRGSLANYAVAAAHDFALTQQDRALQFASVTFDASLEEIFPTLLAGATLVLRDEASAADFHRFSEFCVSNEVSIVNLPTAFWEGWINEADSLPERVRLVVIGGDAASMASLSRWRKVASPQVRLLNTYGPTEGTIVATALDVGSWDGAGFQGPTLPIGTPVANVQAWVCDQWGHSQPPGVPGELIIAGAGVAIGYLGDPQQTQAKFISPAPGAPFEGRGYRTGDRARWTRDGVLEFLGRFDEQVKVNGFRVEVREVEAVLASHPNVKAAAVKVFRRGTAVTLVGYVAEHRALNPAEYRAYLRENLPDYMCPSEIVPLARLPMTSSGKVDKSALAMPAARPGAAVAPRIGNDLEELVASVFSDVLGTEVELDADFFAMGGTSILAILVASRLRKLIAVELPVVRWLLQHPTARGLARTISDARRSDGHVAHSCVIPLKSRGDKAPVFFVPGVFGSVVYLNTLARSFAEDRPLYAFQAPGLDGGEPLASVDELAEHYWQALRALRPDGPYLVAGHSFGATVAYALARRIVESGASVEHLFLVDGLATTKARWDDDYSRAELLSEFAAAFGEFLGVGAPVTAVEMEGLSDEDAFALVRRRFKEAGLAGGGVNLDTLQRFFAVFDANMRAPVGEQNTPLAVRATLIKGAQSAAQRVTNAPSYGWAERFTRELDVVTIPGDHFSMLTAPFVQRLAETLEQRLQGAGAG